MKINRQTLLNELLFVGKAVEKKAVKPILACVLFQAKDGNIQLTGTDLDLTILTSFSADAEDSEFCVSCFDLTNALKNSDSEDVEIKKLKSKIEVKCGKNLFRLPFTNADQYPETPTFKAEKEIELKGSFLAATLNLTSFACANEISRFNLSAISVKNNGVLKVFGTNSRITSFLTSKEKICNFDFEFALPQKSGRAFAALCENAETVVLQIEKNFVSVTDGSTTLISRLSAGTLPNAEAILVDTTDATFSVNAEELLQTIRASQSLDELTVDNFGRFGRLELVRSSPSAIDVIGSGGDSVFESSFAANDVEEFKNFKIDSFETQKLLLAYGKDKELRIKVGDTKLNGFFETEDFNVQFVQVKLNF